MADDSAQTIILNLKRNAHLVAREKWYIWKMPRCGRRILRTSKTPFSSSLAAK
jgi:hypothetical protein